MSKDEVIIGPLRIALRRGEGWQIGRMTCVPVTCEIALHRGRATIGEERIVAGGAAWRSSEPVALVVNQPGERRLVPVLDLNRLLSWAFIGLAVAGTLMAWKALRHLPRTPKGR